MSDVSVIGTGAMGSALVEVLVASGAEVTVWNRTKEKAEALAGPRVRLAESVAEALTSSPLTVVSVSDHELARSLVDEAGMELEGKVVASTSFVTPDQARAFDTAVGAAGGDYLDLTISAYPSQVRSGAGVFFVSGDRAAYEAHRELFERIGRASYVDDAPAAAYISEMAVVLAYAPMAVGLLQGLRICEFHDLSREWFKETVLELYPFHIRSLLERVTEKADPLGIDVEASVNVMADGAAEYATYLRELGLDAGMYDALHRLFTVASEAGHGDADWTCIAEHAATH
jgi:3-hydroxyisobutyrate dehydrogenase-like beta-hydroxyacid dehydrogenase